jgi:hypothetical protein
MKWGYYFDMRDPDELELFASEFCKKKLTTIQEVIAGCIRRGLFDKAVADLSGILTSDMMQDTFLIATSERRAKDSLFEMHQEWLLLDFSKEVPRNIEILRGKTGILPPKKGIIPPNNSQRRGEKKIEEEKRQEEKRPESGAPPAPRDRIGGEERERKKFIAPTFQQVKDYFLSTIGTPDHPKHWPEDKCHNQAGLFHDHYRGNGWVQGKGKPIKDWEATARNWIRRELGGDFKRPEKPGAEPPKTRPAEGSPQLAPIQDELNGMFDLWSANPEHCTVISTTADHYNYLKSAGMIGFSPEEIEAINKLVAEHMAKQQLTGDGAKVRLMKGYGVLEFFKQMKAAGQITIFEL